MKKIFGKLFLILVLSLSVLGVNANKGFVDFDSVLSDVKSQSVVEKPAASFNDGVAKIGNGAFKIIKTISTGLLVLFVVYAGVLMAMSMGESDDDIKKGKKSITYALMGIVFVNIPEQIYYLFYGKKTADTVTSSFGDVSNNSYIRSIFINNDYFGPFIGGVLDFMQVLVVAIAVLMIIYNGVKLVMSFGKSDSLKEPINKITYSMMALVFIGVMNIWRSLMFKGDFKETGASLFTSLANLALYFAVPTGIVFLSYAGYLYISDGGKGENVKKAKSIITNTFIGVILLLGIYYFLNDLSSLNF